MQLRTTGPGFFFHHDRQMLCSESPKSDVGMKPTTRSVVVTRRHFPPVAYSRTSSPRVCTQDLFAILIISNVANNDLENSTEDGDGFGTRGSTN